MGEIKILVVDDHALVRLGLKTLINDQPGLLVIGEAATAEEAIQKTNKLQPDIVLMDIRMPGGGGVQATRQILESHPHIKVIILTSFLKDELILDSIQSGAVGYVLKQANNEVLLRSIEAAARGEALLDSATTANLLVQMRKLRKNLEKNAFHDLSERELSILLEVTRGKTNAEIARDLYLSAKTVRNHVSTIMEKLHLNNRVELATYAMKHNIFEQYE